jgi:hypothetical protein
MLPAKEMNILYHMDLREVVWEDVNWLHVVQERGQWQVLENMVRNLQVP